jgi:hypothetical protein
MSLFGKVGSGSKKVLRISLVFGWRFLAGSVLAFFILFLSFEQSSHCRNNAMLVPMLKKRKRRKEKKLKKVSSADFYLQSK